CPICAPPLSVRYDWPVIDARAPPADPAARRKQRRRMSSVTLPQASAGAALFGRAVLGPLDDASRLVPPRGTFPGRLRVLMSTMRQWGICSGEWQFFRGPGATTPHLFDFIAPQRFRSEAPASFPVHAHFNLLSPVWRRAHASAPLRDRTARRPWAVIR